MCRAQTKPLVLWGVTYSGRRHIYVRIYSERSGKKADKIHVLKQLAYILPWNCTVCGQNLIELVNEEGRLSLFQFGSIYICCVLFCIIGFSVSLFLCEYVSMWVLYISIYE